jgi:hypothetical protein
MAANAASVGSSARQGEDGAAKSGRGVSAGAYGYGLAALATIVGWIVTRKYQLVDPMHGLGYWLGITGASLMAVLLLYPVRKRLRILNWSGATKHWFQIHMIFGVVGPVLILYHSNFQFGSLNSNVALICTLLVAGSGLIGRYFHTKIFSDLEGHRRSLQEMVQRAQLTPEQKARAGALAPHLIERMNRYDALVLEPPEGFLTCLMLPPKLAVTTRIAYLQLVWHAHAEIKREAARAGIAKPQRKRAQAAISAFIAKHLSRVRRVAEFHSYERLFSLWHIFHLPFFYILVLTALVHVLAVHMY